MSGQGIPLSKPHIMWVKTEPREGEWLCQSHTAFRVGQMPEPAFGKIHKGHQNTTGTHLLTLFWLFSLPGMLFCQIPTMITPLAASLLSSNITFSVGTSLTSYLELHFLFTSRCSPISPYPFASHDTPCISPYEFRNAQTFVVCFMPACSRPRTGPGTWQLCAWCSFTYLLTE